MILKNVFLVLVLFAVNSFQLLAQNQSPIVENVIFSERTDGSFFVDVYYDLNDPEESLMTVSMHASSDNGVTWNFSCVNLIGDVGANINNGTGKHIEWDFGLEHPQTFGDQFRIKILADDGGIIMGVPCPGIPTVTYEGKIYNTVQIGEQCWLRENLDVGTRIDGVASPTDNGVIEKYCYNDSVINCESYGGLYQWDEAMQYVTNEGAQGICPAGWHIPTLAEFQTLSTEVGGDGNALKEIGQGTDGGAGTNISGFSALLAGDRDQYGAGFSGIGSYTYFWSSTGYDAAEAGILYLQYFDSNVYVGDTDEAGGFSVRCVKD